MEENRSTFLMKSAFATGHLVHLVKGQEYDAERMHLF